jgi:hypothetical protein
MIRSVTVLLLRAAMMASACTALAQGMPGASAQADRALREGFPSPDREGGKDTWVDQIFRRPTCGAGGVLQADRRRSQGRAQDAQQWGSQCGEMRSLVVRPGSATTATLSFLRSDSRIAWRPCTEVQSRIHALVMLPRPRFNLKASNQRQNIGQRCGAAPRSCQIPRVVKARQES